MEIKVRKAGVKYMEIEISEMNTVIDCGLFDKGEIKELKEHLQSVINEIDEFLEWVENL